jgi:dTDP-4-amino-4,6-dideoxygalactose transaminase
VIQLFRPKYRVEEIIEEIKDTLNSGWTGDGPKCQMLQSQLEEFLGAKQGSVRYLNSATSALHLAIKALNLPKGSKIGTTPITFVSTNAAILYEGHIPTFIDIDPKTLTIDSEKVLKAALNGEIDALLWVHYSGSVSEDFLIICEKLKEWGIPVIEDCAHAMGSFYPKTNMRVGSHPDNISCFSFQAVKNLPTADSGAIVVPDLSVFENVNRLSWLGIDKSTYSRTSSDLYKWKYSVPEIGWKYNPNDIMACIALVQLKYVDQDNAYRRQIHDWYQEGFQKTKIRMISHNHGSSHHLIEVVVPDREKAIQKMKESGFATGVHYLPNYEFDAFSEFYQKGSCPESEEISKNILTLPIHLEITKKHIEKICRIIANND